MKSSRESSCEDGALACGMIASDPTADSRWHQQAEDTVSTATIKRWAWLSAQLLLAVFGVSVFSPSTTTVQGRTLHERTTPLVT